MKPEDLYKANGIVFNAHTQLLALKEIEHHPEVSIRAHPVGAWVVILNRSESREKIIALIYEEIRLALTELKDMGFNFTIEELGAWRPGHLEGETK